MQYKDLQKPLISVVIPTIPSRKHLLKRALKSVNNQTYKNIEILTIDNIDSATKARNRGVNNSKGQFIAFLDDDDEWIPTKLEKQMECMLQHKHVPLVTCYTQDKRFGHDRINKPKKNASQKDIIKAFNYSSTSTYLARKSFLCGLFTFDILLPSAQEYDLAIRLAEHENLLCVPEILVIQHATKGQISENWKRKIQGMIAIYQKHHEKYGFLEYIKFVGMLILFSCGFIIGNNIYKIIIPVKKRHEGD